MRAGRSPRSICMARMAAISARSHANGPAMSAAMATKPPTPSTPSPPPTLSHALAVTP